MFADSPIRAVLLLVGVVALVVWLFRASRGTAPGRRSVRRGPGAGAMGAVYGMLNEDQQRAIEIVVEQKAEAVDPERVRENPKAGAALRRARLATPDDVAEIVRVTNAAYRVEDFFIDGDRTSAAEILEKIARSDCGFLVVDVPSGNGLSASVYFERRGARMYFGMLSVAPAHQKTGLGRVLIDAVEARARAVGCAALEIDVVNVREELPAFYNAMGFTPTGTAPFLKGHKTKRPVHMILMEKALLSKE